MTQKFPMNATTVKFKIDTGADITVMSKQTFQVEEELQRMLKSEVSEAKDSCDGVGSEEEW